MLVPAACGVTILVILALRKKGGNGKGLTPELKDLYDGALDGLNDPSSLRKLASKFGAEGCEPQAFVLNKLADYLSLSPQDKALHRELYKKAMASKDADKVLIAAKVFEDMGAINAAGSLRHYADCLKKAEAA